jgi:hypothetical protein
MICQCSSRYHWMIGGKHPAGKFEATGAVPWHAVLRCAVPVAGWAMICQWSSQYHWMHLASIFKALALCQVMLCCGVQETRHWGFVVAPVITGRLAGSTQQANLERMSLCQAVLCCAVSDTPICGLRRAPVNALLVRVCSCSSPHLCGWSLKQATSSADDLLCCCGG